MLDFGLLQTIIILTFIGVSWYIYEDFSDGVIRIYFTTVVLATVIGMIGLFFYYGLIPNELI